MHCGPIAFNIVSNSHLFHSKSFDLPIPKIWYSKIWQWKSKVKFMGEVKVQSHNLGPISYRLPSFWFHVKPPSYCYDRPFKHLTFKSKVKVIAQGHLVWITSYPLISLSFHVDRLSGSWIQLFQKLTLKIQGQGHGWDQVPCRNVSLTSYRLISHSFHDNRPSHSWDTAVSKFDVEISRSTP